MTDEARDAGALGATEDGIDADTAAALRAEGYETPEAVADASARELAAVVGVREAFDARATATGGVVSEGERPLVEEFDAVTRELMRATEMAVRERAEGRRGEITDLTDVAGVGETLAERLADAGYETPSDVALADADDLTAVEGVGEDLAADVRRQVGSEPWVDDLHALPGDEGRDDLLDRLGEDEGRDDLLDRLDVDEEEVTALWGAGIETADDLRDADRERVESVLDDERAAMAKEAVTETRTVDLAAVAASADESLPADVESPRAVPYDAVFGPPGENEYGETFKRLNRALTSETLFALDDAGVRTVEDLLDADRDDLSAALDGVDDGHLPDGTTQADVVARARETATLRRTRPGTDRLVTELETDRGEPSVRPLDDDALAEGESPPMVRRDPGDEAEPEADVDADAGDPPDGGDRGV